MIFFRLGGISLVCACFWARAFANEDGAQKHFTEEALKQYDGSVTGQPIYLAINGTVFDVSASPAFYGPGGHYHHFTGKDASRAWVSECWDSPEQLTWRMDGVHEMFMPKYMDEQMQQAAGGNADFDGAAEYGQDELARMAKVMMGKFGQASEEDMAKRRANDLVEAQQRVHDQLAHWVKFFAGNEKYEVVGRVIRDEEKPDPPALCEEALKKRPLKGGMLDDVMKKGKVGGKPVGGKAPPKGKPSREEL